MTLDSTGFSEKKKIPCFICDKTKLEYRHHTPEYGHDGAALDCGPCMGAHGDPILNMAGAKFFTLIRGSDTPAMILRPKETQISRSGNPYHYGGYHAPTFGTRPQETVFVCAHCVAYYGEDLEKRVSEIADHRLNQEYAILLHAFFVGTSWRRVSEPNRWKLRKRLDQFIEDLESLAPGYNINRALRTFRKIRTRIAPKAPLKKSA
jgi:hypothetical protein